MRRLFLAMLALGLAACQSTQIEETEMSDTRAAGTNKAFFHELKQFTLAHNCVTEVQSCKFSLLWKHG